MNQKMDVTKRVTKNDGFGSCKIMVFHVISGGAKQLTQKNNR